MSDQRPPEAEPAEPVRPVPTLGMKDTPNAEKYVLEADAMRRRQLRSALLHGSRRTWREHPRVWPAVVVGIIVVAVIIAGLIVAHAFQKTQENEKKQEQEQKKQNAPSAPRTPGKSTKGQPSQPAGPSPTRQSTPAQ